MAIQLFCGLPGSGKSYGVIENILLPALHQNRKILTNIPLQLEAIEVDFPFQVGNIKQIGNDEITPEFLMEIPGGTVIIIDECWRWWPAGDKTNNIQPLYKEFFSEHRHKVGEDGKTQEIILVTQSPSDICLYLRQRIDKTVISNKNDAAGSKTTYNVGIYQQCPASLEKRHLKGEISSSYGKYKQSVFKYYKSHTKSESALPGLEQTQDKRATIYNSSFFRFLLPAVGLGCIWGAFTVYGFFHKQEQVPEPSPTLPTSNLPQKINPPMNVTSPNKESKRFRVAGTVYRDGFLFVLVHVADQPHMISLQPGQCKLGGLNGPECTIDGELVTSNTGQHTPKSAPSGRQDLKNVVPEMKF